MDAKRSVRVADILVRDGKIAQIGPIAKRDEARRIDARGAFVLPGLVQAHVHLCQALFRGLADDLPLLPWLKERIWPLEGAHDPQSLRVSARLGLAEMLLSGTTTILDMGTVHHQEAIFGAMVISGIRGFSGKAIMDAGERPTALHETTKSALAESHRLCRKWNGRGRLGYAYAPRFILSSSESAFRECAEASESTGALLHTHAAEHADERAAVQEVVGCDDIEALEEWGFVGARTVLAHGVQLRVSEMRRLALAGASVVHCPSANLKLASGIAQVCKMREAGLVVALGADGAPCNNMMDPWVELRQAALLAKVRSKNAAALPAREALELATIEGARALGLDDAIGSIEVGKQADLIVVNADGLHGEPARDVYSRLVYATRATDVRHVMIGGDLVVDGGTLQTLDIDEVRHDARKEAGSILQRAGLK